MKLVSRVSTLRNKEKLRVDTYYAQMMANAVGPLAILHTLKRTLAVNAIDSELAPIGQHGAILNRASELDNTLAVIDQERRELKKELDDAQSSDKVREIMERFDDRTKNHTT